MIILQNHKIKHKNTSVSALIPGLLQPLPIPQQTL